MALNCWHVSCFCSIPETALSRMARGPILRRFTVAVKAVEERLTVAEQKVEENARAIEGLRGAVVELGRRMDQRFEAIDQRFEAIDQRFEAMERRFEAMESRFDRMEQRFEQRLDRLDQQMSRQFFWVVGIQITTVLAMTGAIAAIAAAALGS